MINSLAIEKVSTAKEILNNKADWAGYEFNIVDAQKIIDAVNSGVNENVISLMPLFY